MTNPDSDATSPVRALGRTAGQRSLAMREHEAGAPDQVAEGVLVYDPRLAASDAMIAAARTYWDTHNDPEDMHDDDLRKIYELMHSVALSRPNEGDR